MTTNKKKILFVIPDLRSGGAETSLLQICEQLHNDIDIDLYVIRNDGQYKTEFEKYTKTIISITKNKYKFILFNRFYKLFLNQKKINRTLSPEVANQYDMIISFLEGSATFITNLIQSKSKKIAWIHTSIIEHKKILDYTSYNKIICCSNFVKEELSTLNIDATVIYNLIDTKKINRLSKEEVKMNNNFNIVTVARFDSAKALDRLIKISNEIYDEGINHQLYIVGHGRLYKNLCKLVKDDHISILNDEKNVYKYMKRSDLFVLLSKYEGYGMVIDEALFLGRKVLVTNTNSAEAVGFGRYGAVCNNDDKSIKESLIYNIKNDKNIFKPEKKNIEIQNEKVITMIRELFDV